MGDSLDSILNSLEGIDTKSFLKPKTMADMKNQKRNSMNINAAATNKNSDMSKQFPMEPTVPSVAPNESLSVLEQGINEFSGVTNGDPFTGFESPAACVNPPSNADEDPFDLFGDVPPTTSSSIPLTSSAEDLMDGFAAVPAAECNKPLSFVEDNPFVSPTPMPPAALPPRQPSSKYKVFDFVDAEEYYEERKPISPPVEPSSPPPGGLHHRSTDRPAEVLAEASQKAAKLLQSGTRWFMKTSKHIVQEVHTKFHEHQGGHKRHQGRTQSYGRERHPPAYYYEWASQLARMSPNTQGATLSALSEYDRLEVQRILDENALGETYLHRRPPPPPPSYDEVIKEPRVVVEKPIIVEEEDLLGLHTTSNVLVDERSGPDGLFQTTRKTTRNANAFESMIDLGESLPVHHSAGLNPKRGSAMDETAQEEEPEQRRLLREKRLAIQAERIQRQLAEKQEREENERAEKEGKVVFRDTLKPKIDRWAHGKSDNIRALLSSLHVVLWEDSGWTPPSIADMVEDAKVKRVYMKANLIVHPDKVKQKGGSLEHIATAEMLFDVLKRAWGKFEQGALGKS